MKKALLLFLLVLSFTLPAVGKPSSTVVENYSLYGSYTFGIYSYDYYVNLTISDVHEDGGISYSYQADVKRYSYINGTLNDTSVYHIEDNNTVRYNEPISVCIDDLYIPISFEYEELANFLSSVYMDALLSEVEVVGSLNGSLYSFDYITGYAIEHYEIDLSLATVVHYSLSDGYREIDFYISPLSSDGAEIDTEDMPYSGERLTRTFGRLDEIASVSIIPDQLLTIEGKSFYYFHYYKLFNNTFVEGDILVGESFEFPEFELFPFLYSSPSGLEGSYYVPFDGSTTAYYDNRTIGQGPYESPSLIASTGDGLLLALSLQEGFFYYQGHTEGLASIYFSNDTLVLSYRNSSEAELYVNHELVETFYLNGTGILEIPLEEYANFTIIEEIELYVDNAAYLFGYTYILEPIVQANFSVHENLVDISLNVSDLSYIDGMKIEINGEIYAYSAAQVGFLMNFTIPVEAPANIHITITNPYTGSSRDIGYDVLVTNHGLEINVTYTLNGSKASFSVEVHGDEENYTMNVYVDGELVLSKTIGSSYEFELNLEGSHNVTIVVTDSRGNEARRSAIIGGGEGGSVGEGQNFMTIIILVMVIVALLLALLKLRER